MGKSITPKYRVVIKANVPMTDAAWHGKPTAKRLAEYMDSLNKSFLPNGCNWHVSAQGIIVYCSKGYIVEQSTGETVAEWNSPMFQVF